MKKKLLFVIPGLDAGGAEKSLVNLLNTIDENKFSVDLFMFSHQGLFIKQVPEFVRILPKNNTLIIFQKSMMASILTFLKRGAFSLAKDRFLFYLKNKLIKNRGIAEQYSWQNLKNGCSPLEENYDVAIGFLEKSSIYFVGDKVKAVHKVAFIHTFYSELHLDLAFDKKYFEQLNRIAVVSSDCAKDLIHIFPSFKEKIAVVPNIVSSKLIHQLSQEQTEELPKNVILSVGRLVAIKGFDLAIEAARILKEKKVNFNWYIIGEGDERSRLQQLIETYHLQQVFTLLGLKENPYPYIREAQVFVQCSRYEGKSIAVDEAKILAKPIVLTNFSTAKDQIEHGKNGLICDMTAEALADSIIKYLADPKFTAEIIAYLQADNFGTEKEIVKFYNLLNE